MLYNYLLSVLNQLMTSYQECIQNTDKL